MLIDSVIFCYNVNSQNSIDLAAYYQLVRGLDSDHLIELDCSLSISISEAEFETTIETPLIAAIEGLGHSFEPGGTKRIFTIIIGMDIPYLYTSDDNTFSIPGRLHRLGHEFNILYRNPSFHRVDFSFFGSEYSQELFVVSVLDAPTLLQAKQIIDRGLNLNRENRVTGSIFLNPYGNYQAKFEQSMLDFVQNNYTDLSVSMQKKSSFEDAVFDYADSDSFFFGSGDSTVTSSFFANHGYRRTFLFHSGSETAINIREPMDEYDSPLYWCNTALEVGYACCAGMVSEDDVENWMNPRAFFESLHQGATIGESFLFSCPVLSGKMVLFGDPLGTVILPGDLPFNQDPYFDFTDNEDTIRQTKNMLERSLAYGARAATRVSDIVDRVVASGELTLTVETLLPLRKWQNCRNAEYYKDLLVEPVGQWARYIQDTTGMSVQNWLRRRGEKISSDLQDLCVVNGVEVEDVWVRESGAWEFEFVYTHPYVSFEYVYFELQVALDSEYDTILFTIDSSSDSAGWSYEKEYCAFESLDGAFPSNLSSRRARFVAPEDYYVDPETIYYVRWRAFEITDPYGDPYDDPYYLTSYNIPEDPKIIGL